MYISKLSQKTKLFIFQLCCYVTEFTEKHCLTPMMIVKAIPEVLLFGLDDLKSAVSVPLTKL